MSAPPGRAREPAPPAAARRRARSSTVISTIMDDAADVLGEGELPADQDPEHQPQLPDQVGRGELEGERRGAPRRPSGTATWRSRSPRRSRRRRRRRGRSPRRRGREPLPESAASIRSRGTQAWTTPEIAKPSTSAHQTSYAIRKDCSRPSPIVLRTSPMPSVSSKPSSGQARPRGRAARRARRRGRRPLRLRAPRRRASAPGRRRRWCRRPRRWRRRRGSRCRSPKLSSGASGAAAGSRPARRRLSGSPAPSSGARRRSAIAQASPASIAVGSAAACFCISAKVLRSAKRSSESLEPAPSVPSPTATPASRAAG